MNTNITEMDVRHYMADQLESDNAITAGELRFTPEEIHSAMKCAAREFNSLPPIGVASVSPDRLPGDTNVFLDGIAAALLRMVLLRLTANDLEVRAGNVTATISAAQISHLKQTTIPLFTQRFEKTATDIKVSINLSQAFGSIGGTC